MCGIVAIISKDGKVVNKIMNSLKQLEYRGYDSSGIAILKDSKIKVLKSIGKIKNLEEKITENFDSNIAIAHTRWATHGTPTETNAHPHISFSEDVAVVHNGIIENYQELRNFLEKEGYIFKTQTDTEVIPNLISYYFKKTNSMKEAFFSAINELKGSYSIATFCKDDKKLFIAKNGSPLLFGIGKDEFYIASGPTAFSGLTNEIITLNDGEVGIIKADGYKFFDLKAKEIKKEIETIKVDDFLIDKGDFSHFMLKEIYEQPDVIERTILEYIDVKNKKIVLPKFNFSLKDVNYLTIVACGTSYYAGCLMKYFFEEIANIFVNVDTASEFRYRNSPLIDGGVSLFISQSGETADTIAALKNCKEKGQKIVSLINTVQSNIGSLSDTILKVVAGVEIGVASTKAFTGQISVLYLLALEIAKEKGLLSIENYQHEIEKFIELPNILKNFLKNENNINSIKDISSEISKADNLLYMGRSVFSILALEGSLKIKELSYIPSEGLVGGELKHGPIALIDEGTYVITLLNSNILFDKTLSNIEQIIARKGKVITVADSDCKEKLNGKIYKNIELIPSENKFTNVVETVLPIQLLAYYTALAKGNDIDKPRNLAKSVTVE